MTRPTLYTLDMETYFDRKSGYSLGKMTTESYIRHPEFYVQGVGIKKEGGKARWFPAEKVATILRQLNLHECAVVSHNAMFDMAVLNWVYGIKPLMIFDTLSMARASQGSHESASLAALAKKHNLGDKGDELYSVEGVKYLSDYQSNRLGGYCENDCDLTYDLFKILVKGYPSSELALIDLTIRMFTEPKLELDRDTLDKSLAYEQGRKAVLMEKVGCERGDLSSNDKFAEVLRGIGIEPPTKISAKTKKKTYAFAKSDADFKALMNHENEDVRFLVEARLGIKSTGAETRTQRLLGIQERGALPMPLLYYGAHTGRYSATDKINVQNFPRVTKDPNSGLLRKSIVAPKGHVLVVADASQIEARLLVWQAGQTDQIQVFADGGDPYSSMASKIFGKDVNPDLNPDDKPLRFIGKMSVLGCGYGLGHNKFAHMIYIGMMGAKGILFDEAFAENLFVDVGRYKDWVNQREDNLTRFAESRPLELTEEQWYIHCACADRIIASYRSSSPKVKQYWNTCGEALEYAMRGSKFHFGPNGLLETTQDAILFPNGMKMRYPELIKNEDGEFTYLRRKEGRVQKTKTYGGSVVENCTQGLARIIITDAMLRINRRYPVVGQVHDEILALAPEEEGEEAYAFMVGEMTKAPDWCPDLPLGADGGWHKSYGFAK